MNKSKLTKKRALEILIKTASNDIGGQEFGYRSTSNEWRETVSNTIRKLYKDAYGRNITSSDEYNLHISMY